MGVSVFMYIFQGQTPDLLDQILQALVPASLSGTLLWFSPQMLENPWNKCSDWSSSDACVRYQSLAQSQFLLGVAVFSLESWISLALSWLYCETEMNVHPILLWYVTLAKLLNLCECEDYTGDNKLRYGRKHATYVKASQFFFFPFPPSFDIWDVCFQRIRWEPLSSLIMYLWLLNLMTCFW